MHLTAAHWVYLAGVVVILATMIMRKNIVVPAVAATFVTALVFSHNLVTGLSAIFNASLVAATNLFNIFLIIALVTAMLGALKALGADRRMVTPFRRVMRNGHISFWLLAAITYVISLFFWPTPAVPLIGAVLIPVAIGAGLSPIGVGLVVAVAGQGMALSSDYIIRVAPGLSAKAAGADPNLVSDRALVLSLIVGGVALVIAYAMEFRKIRKPSAELLTEWENGVSLAAVPASGEPAQSVVLLGGSASGGATSTRAAARAADDVAAGVTAAGDGPAGDAAAGDRATDGAVGTLLARAPTKAAGNGVPNAPDGADPDCGPADEHRNWSAVFAILVPLAYLALVVYMVVAKVSSSVPDLNGGDAAALVGGIATLLLFLAALAKGGRRCLESSAAHVVDGLVFAFKAMGVVLPIAGFFFIGNGDFAGQILGISDPKKTPAFLFQLVEAAQSHIPHSGFITGFGTLVIGMIAGLEGSGFSGLPLTGSLAGSLGPAVHMSPATLAAIGQMGNIWSGGGTLVAWSSLVTVAGFARVSVVDLARRCFIPVVVGLVAATLFAVLFL